MLCSADCNFARLTGDVRWPAWTPFAEAIGNGLPSRRSNVMLILYAQGPLAGAFPLLSLRTNKADVVTGVEKETAERLDASGEKWRVDGRWVGSLLPVSS